MADAKNISIATLLLLLAGTGSYELFSNMDFSKPVYYCETRIELGPQYCNRFSTSGIRCYPNELDNKGYKDCSIGWTEIKNNMIIPNESTVEPVRTSGSWCYDYGCIPKEV